MKKLLSLAPVLFCVLMSCSDEPIPKFSLVMHTNYGDTTVTYTLTNSSITLEEHAPQYTGDWKNDFHSVLLNEASTLSDIAVMDPKSYSCDEQHALAVYSITFTNDSGTFEINPNVNHPQEIDEAVRIFNQYAPENRKLRFEDMQPAIEPTGKMQL
jgi:hypothetical protein